jgi:hypothetical protein
MCAVCAALLSGQLNTRGAIDFVHMGERGAVEFYRCRSQQQPWGPGQIQRKRTIHYVSCAHFLPFSRRAAHFMDQNPPRVARHGQKWARKTHSDRFLSSITLLLTKAGQKAATCLSNFSLLQPEAALPTTHYVMCEIAELQDCVIFGIRLTIVSNMQFLTLDVCKSDHTFLVWRSTW